MKVISVLNHKGGVGKSTISTNIAGYYANKGGKVLLGDFDIQQSSQTWLTLRPEEAAKIGSWEIVNGKLQIPPKETTHIIVDSPAGITAKSLEKIVSISNKIIVPLKPSLFDMSSTQSFFDELITTVNASPRNIDVCVVGNMVDIKSKSFEQLRKFLNDIGLDNPAHIRQGQIYVQLVAHGLSLFDSKSDIFKKEMEGWIPLLKWIEK